MFIETDCLPQILFPIFYFLTYALSIYDLTDLFLQISRVDESDQITKRKVIIFRIFNGVKNIQIINFW